MAGVISRRDQKPAEKGERNKSELSSSDNQGTVSPRGPARVVAYHGCRRSVAEQVLQGTPFLPSLNGYDWLGAGIYFWEYAPFRAQEWAEQRFYPDQAVLQATLTLDHSLNLLDTAHFAGLQYAYSKTVKQLSAQNILVPRNKDKKHYLDRAIVEFYCQDRAAEGLAFQAVRGCFPEGAPVYDGSKILRETHVQIAVRDPSCISEVALLDLG